MALVLTRSQIKGPTMYTEQFKMAAQEAASHRLTQARLRSVRRPFTPSEAGGPYRLPRTIRERLAASLTAFRNREAAFTLAVFLARYWSAPGRIERAFPIDRRALAERSVNIGLTEAQVRGAIRTLEKVCFLDRAIPAPGSHYKATPEGLHRRPVLFQFGSEYASGFMAANRRAYVAQERRSEGQGTQILSYPSLLCVRLSAASVANSPKNSSEAKTQVLMGDFVKGCREGLRVGPTGEPISGGLEAALKRLGEAVTG